MPAIHVATTLPAGADEVFELIQRVSTFLEVTRPLLALRNPEVLPERLTEGVDVVLRLGAPGLPATAHRIRVVEVDPERRLVRTNESSALVPRWDHTLAVSPIDAHACRYADHVELGGGPRAHVVRAGGTLFYRYRQERLRRLVSG